MCLSAAKSVKVLSLRVCSASWWFSTVSSWAIFSSSWVVSQLLSSLIFSLFVLVIVVIANKRRLPGELIGLVIAVLAMKIANLERFGISVVGKIPSGLPTVSIPDLSIENIRLETNARFIKIKII